MDLYREEILNHWQNPQNFGQIKNADLVIEQVNPLCGDEITLYFKFSKENLKNHKRQKSQRGQRKNSNSKPHTVILNGFHELTINSVKNLEKGSFASAQDDIVIDDVRFTGNGCAISIASASMLTEVIKGKRVRELEKITGEDVLKILGGSIAPARLKCAFLPLEAIRKISL